MVSKKPFLTISSALMLGLTIVINWFVITIVFSIFFPESYLVLSLLTICALAGLSLTPVAESITRFFFGCRRPTREEMALIEKPWKTVLQASGLINKKNKPELFISDQPFPNAFAVAIRTVCITRGFLKIGTPVEIAGVLAHEVGHLVNGDTKRRMIASVINSAGNVANWILITIVTILGIGGQITGIITRQSSMVIFSWLLGLTVIFFKACLWVLQWLVHIGFLAVGRKEELAADDFAKNVGFANGLISYLRKVEGLDVQPTGAWAALSQTHPPIPVRIDRLLYGSPEKQ